MFCRELPRICELRDLLPDPVPPGAYFRNLDESLARIPQKLKQFRDIERDLDGLDPEAWEALKIGIEASACRQALNARLASPVRQAQ